MPDRRGDPRSDTARDAAVGRDDSTVAVFSGKTSRRQPPLWRRILVWLFIQTGKAALLFVVASVALVVLFRFVNPPPTINMLLVSMSGEKVDRKWVSLGAMAKSVPVAVMAGEDTRFCTHEGFDLEEIRRALDKAERGGRLRGASTVSQQTAKNVFLWNGGGFARKGVEAWFTFLIERVWTKRRIMEVYLNVAEWGDGHFGVEAAARARFGVSAINLSTDQAARLAAVLPSPNKWSATKPGPAVRKRVGQITARMKVIRRDGLDDCLDPAPAATKGAGKARAAAP